MTNRISILLIMFVAAAILCAYLQPLEDLERRSVDLRFSHRGAGTPIDDITLIAVDDASVKALARPGYLWNPLYAEFLKGTAEASAAVVMLDLIFKAASDRPLREFIQKFFADHGVDIPEVVLRRFSLDLPLREAILSVKRLGLQVVLGYTWQNGQPVIIEDALLRSVPFDHVGFFNISTDPDRSVRSAVLYGFEPQSGRLLPSVDLVTASLSRPGLFTYDNSELKIGGKVLNTYTSEREALINFAGPAGTFPIVSFKDILSDIREHPEKLTRFAKKTLLVGMVDIADVKMTSVGPMSGIELHANIIENLIKNSFLRCPPSWFEPLFLVFTAICMAWAWNRNIYAATLITLGGCSIWGAACVHSFSNGLLLPMVRPLFFILGCAVFSVWRMYRQSERSRQKVRELFGRYVNDSVVSTLLQYSEEKLSSGSRRRICIMFVDIRGFTTFAENKPPDEVVSFLNKYFEGLTEIVLAHDGVVDKFLGDGLMAFFNAPLDVPEYAVKAADTALAMREFIKDSQIRKLVDPFDLKIGIALHEGPAVVGNIGSQRKTEFTAIGDTVNTASRLETLNKEFGTDIIASEQMVQAAGEVFEWRFLEERSIRGREGNIKLYALIGRKQLVEGMTLNILSDKREEASV